MKIRNKTTGEIATLTLDSDGESLIIMKDDEMIVYGVSLEGLVQNWEDCEEPINYWFIDEFGLVQEEIEYYYEDNKEVVHDKKLAIGNYFETKEEAEQAVEKLKAVKRLKDKGFRFDRWKNDKEKYLGDFVIYAHTKDLTDIVDDLNLLFRGE